MEYIEKTLTGIITHGTNSITFTDDFITNESIIDVYFSSDDIVPTDQVQDGNRLIVSIEPKNYDVSIAVHITNDDTINYSEELESLNDTVESLSDAVDSHATTLSDLELEFETLDSKVDGLNASNINYDEYSTIYSAMGNVDELETTNKNLVGAINEVKESGGGGGGSVTDLIISQILTTTFTIGSGSFVDKTLSYETPTGYTPLCALPVTAQGAPTGGADLFFSKCEIERNSNRVRVYLTNAKSGSKNTSCAVQLLFIKTEALIMR